MPTITYNLAPNPVWQFTDFAALFLAGGKMYTYRDTARTTPKPVYKDPAGMTAWPNPLIFSDPDGSNYPIYWSSDENYFVEIFDKNGGGPLYTFTQFNAPGFVKPGPDLPPIKNYVIDGQFRFQNDSTFLNVQRGTWLSPKWLFTKTSPSTAVDNITFPQFAPGQTQVPFGPTNYLDLLCNSPGTDAEKAICHFFDDVYTFQGQTLVFSFWAKSSFSSTLSLLIKQFFGSGGSSPIATGVQNFNLTPTWTFYSSAPFVVPSISGQTIAGGNDTFEVFFNVPPTSPCNLSLANVQIQLGQLATPYDFNGYDLERSKSFGQKLPVPAFGNPSPDQGKFVTLGTENLGSVPNEPAFVLTSLPVYTGFIQPVFAPPSAVFPGWAFANGTFLGSYVNNMEAYNLYVLLQSLATSGGPAVVIGNDGFIATLVDGGVNVLVTNENVGVTTNASDVNTGLSIVVEVPGTIFVQQQTKIFGLPASALTPGTYFLIDSVSHNYYCYLVINGVGNNPNLFGLTGIPIYLTSGMTTNQVSAEIAFQLTGAIYATPDLTGYFLRFGPTNPSNVRDPDYLARSGGNTIGSTQSSAFQTHGHGLSYPGNATPSIADTSITTATSGYRIGGPPDATFATYAARTATDGPNSGNISTGESRGINTYLLPLIKL